MPIEYSKTDKPPINNDYYHSLAERWYTATDDPVALLRAEARLRNPWIYRKSLELPKGEGVPIQLLDVGCGGGFLSNYLAERGFVVTGVDLSESSLAIAKARDKTKTANYILADAYELPFEDQSFDVITSTDFLEHVHEPRRVLKEVSRCLRKNGLFFFHTFNKTKLAHLLVIKSLEWFVKNTPRNLHVIDLFIPPQDLTSWMREYHLETMEIRGIRPVFFQMPLLKMVFRGEVDETFRFSWTRSLAVSYAGIALKR